MRAASQRTYAILIAVGASILLYRTVSLAFFEGGLQKLLPVFVVLTFVEMAVDAACLGFSIRWAVHADSAYARVPLRLGAAATLIHFLRVAVFALGRTELFRNFEVRPEYRQTYEMDVFWVYFASVLALLGVVGVVVIFLILRTRRARQ